MWKHDELSDECSRSVQAKVERGECIGAHQLTFQILPIVAAYELKF